MLKNQNGQVSKAFFTSLGLHGALVASLIAAPQLEKLPIVQQMKQGAVSMGFLSGDSASTPIEINIQDSVASSSPNDIIVAPSPKPVTTPPPQKEIQVAKAPAPKLKKVSSPPVKKAAHKKVVRVLPQKVEVSEADSALPISPDASNEGHLGENSDDISSELAAETGALDQLEKDNQEPIKKEATQIYSFFCMSLS